MLLHYLHGADDARLLAIRLIEEGEIPLLHGAQIVPSYIVSYSWWWLIRKIPLKIKPTFFFVHSPSHGSGSVLAARSSMENLTSTPFSMRDSGSALSSQYDFPELVPPLTAWSALAGFLGAGLALAFVDLAVAAGASFSIVSRRVRLTMLGADCEDDDDAGDGI